MTSQLRVLRFDGILSAVGGVIPAQGTETASSPVL